MITLSNIQAVNFIGIGGIGMSALAKYFLAKGVVVFGYDKTPTAITQQLEELGAKIHFTEDENNIQKNVQLVVYTPAIPSAHIELQYYFQNNYTVVKRSEVLQIISESLYNICVAGTHGKTTISTMIAHLLRHSNFGCNAFLGGISANYETNFWSHPNNVAVIEADEYDRSFLKLSPNVAVISSMDADHLDIYKSKPYMEDAFIEFASKLKKGGLLIKHFDLLRKNDFVADNQITYHLHNAQAQVYAKNIHIKNGGYTFDVMVNGDIINEVELQIGGLHNIENIVATIAVAHYLQIDSTLIKAAVASFKGVKRRFEKTIINDQLVYIDDYAHHPQELMALLTSIKHLYPHADCHIIFQPHLFTRTRDFANEFSQALALANQVYLLPIYPARELPIDGVTSSIIAENIPVEKVRLISKDDVPAICSAIKDKNKNQIIVTAGAGDIDQLVNTIKNILK